MVPEERRICLLAALAPTEPNKLQEFRGAGPLVADNFLQKQQ
jgi:hypothetical protein